MTSFSEMNDFGRVFALLFTAKILDLGLSLAPLAPAVSGRVGVPVAVFGLSLFNRRKRLDGGSASVVVDAFLLSGGSWTFDDERLSRSL